MITITESAKKKIAKILEEESDPTLKIRAFVQGGGCSGFQYGVTLDNNQADDDWELDGILVDAASMQYLQGATIDYTENMMASSFTIINPNATATCGCGSSFAA